MAYMRGKYYLWVGSDEKEDRLHIWVADGGTSHHENTGWSENMKEVDELMGCSIPMKVMDEYVMMRYAQLEKEGKVDKVAMRAIRHYGGNFGVEELCHKYGQKSGQDELHEHFEKIDSKKKKGKKV
jgi:hypothetical protein